MSLLPQLTGLLRSHRHDTSSPHPPVVQAALHIARELQRRASRLQTPAERRQLAELDRMLQNPEDKSTLTQLTDRAFRSSSTTRATEQFIHILDVQGVPRFFSPMDRTLLSGFQTFGGLAPGLAIGMVKAHLQKETAHVILPGEEEWLGKHLSERRAEGVRMNVNFLGEAILGEGEANRRLQAYLQALQQPDIEVISVKISTLYSQISPLARRHTVQTLCERLDRLYHTSMYYQFERADGTTTPKFIYLDMEEYRDMSLTAEVFMEVLSRPALKHAHAGIVLQAYIPDSFNTQQRINEWARKRVAAGGSPITLRLVKGANMEMERLEASLRGWPQAPFKSKRETDANYKRMLHEGMRPENLAAVRLGIASHNLFELAYGLALAVESGALDRVEGSMDRVQFEMLEGMANHQRRALGEVAQNILLYAPVCRREQFLSAVGYLIRRLDENTGPENFLRHAFKIEVGGSDWIELQEAWIKSHQLIPSLNSAPRRTQDRSKPPAAGTAITRGWQHFVNEPDTDFSLPHNSDWADRIIEEWRVRTDASAPTLPLMIAGRERSHPGEALRDCLDPSRPGVVVGRYSQAISRDIEDAVQCAATDPSGWRSLPDDRRFEILGRVADEIRRHRADLMGAALANGGKTLAESDPEVSEAVDFVEFYRDAARWFRTLETVEATPKGVVVVVSPWNFPIAIPCGGIAAALAAGNTVILKPASDAVLVAWELCQCFWRAGVPREALQFVPCSGGSRGRQLVSHLQVSAVILTGGTATAFSMLRDHPGMTLYAETGGKNATIVTAMADRDQAIKHVLHSAFSHSGQKCSATSLLLLEREVYEDAHFKASLIDALQSLSIGSAWQTHNKIGPLIRTPSEDLERALKVLEPGESWALMPQILGGNPNLWSCGLKWGVQPGSYTHGTEFFGPVLGVIPFDRLSEAIEIVNQTGYGLTSGLESLDDREQEEWLKGIAAGNLYINRPTTGAIVLRQPFGGMGRSAFGPGIKAGGPNYVALLMHFQDRATPVTPAYDPAGASKFWSTLTAALPAGIDGGLRERLRFAADSYDRAWRTEFSLRHDHFRLIGQDNYRHYLPLHALCIRIEAGDGLFEQIATITAARIAGATASISLSPDCEPQSLAIAGALADTWDKTFTHFTETEAQLISRIQTGEIERMRYATPGKASGAVRSAAADIGLCLVDHPVVSEGRIELLWYLQEQSVSIDYHRYGNLGKRSQETRQEPG